MGSSRFPSCSDHPADDVAGLCEAGPRGRRPQPQRNVAGLGEAGPRPVSETPTTGIVLPVTESNHMTKARVSWLVPIVFPCLAPALRGAEIRLLPASVRL